MTVTQAAAGIVTPTDVPSPRTDRRTAIVRAIAVGLWVVIVGLAVTEIWMILTTLDRPSDQWGFRGYEAGLALAFGSVCAFIAVRRPGNLIGWLGLIPALVSGIQGVAVQSVVVAEAAGRGPADTLMARWLGAWVWVVAVGAFLAIFPLFFPDGRLPSRRWRAALALAVIAISFQIGSIVVNTEPLGSVRASNNPQVFFEAMGPRGAIGYLLLWLAAFVSVSSLVQRYRHAATEERQQIKWVVYAIVLVTVGAAVGMTPIFAGQVFFLATAFLGASAIGIAILRYRLYEIDVIVNRTLVYGALTAVLAGVYTASITLSTRVFSSVTGERSDAAIVLTTLIVVSLVTPVKTRLQTLVDRETNARQRHEGAAIRSSLEALQALEGLVRLNATGGLTAREFRVKKAELLRRV